MCIYQYYTCSTIRYNYYVNIRDIIIIMRINNYAWSILVTSSSRIFRMYTIVINR